MNKVLQIMECVKCGHKSKSFSPPKMPWEVWLHGCPKCGSSKVDVIVVVDKSNRIRKIEVLGE